MKKLLRRFTSLLLVFAIILLQSHIASAAENPYFTSFKWNKRTLYYYFDSSSSVGSIPKDEYTYWNIEIPGSFRFWNDYFRIYDINLKFIQTSTKSNADIIVRYGNGPSLANVTYSYSGSTLTKATITLDDFDFYTMHKSDLDIRKIVKHEIGHTLGLKDITVQAAIQNNIESIMVNDMADARSTTYPTYYFDRVNLLKMYK